MTKLMIFSTLLIFSAVSSFATALAAGEFKQGRYVGYIQLDDNNEKVAVVVNTFMVQPEDFTAFPTLNAIFTLYLGGYGSPEYITETFEDIRYDFNSGQLALDEPANDLVITAEIQNPQRPTVSGQVWIRSAAKSGTISVVFETDEPDSPITEPEVADGFMTSLRGEYEGFCGEQHAKMQLTSGKGLDSADPSSHGLNGYAITAKLAFDEPGVCGDLFPDEPVWCVSRSYESGTYNFFSNSLTLESARGGTTCSLANGRLQCGVRMLDVTLACDLNKTDQSTLPYRAFVREFNVRATAEQRLPLPAPAPPQHAALVQALKGQFLGYLHHEGTNRYQPFKLNVIPTVSTVNPHNENEIFVSTTAVTYFGRMMGQTFWAQQLEKRSFYLRPGFTLESPNTDGFLQIEDWRQGYIKAVWYSHGFGRVGTVQLVKATSLPELPPEAAVVGSIAGEFQGPPVADNGFNWWFKTLVPTQLAGRDHTTFSFFGTTQLSGGIIVPIPIAEGTYDPYTGAVSWLTDEESPRMVIGSIDDAEKLNLFWPGASKWGVRVAPYRFVPFERVSE